MHVLVLGAGAVGCFLGGRLAMAGHAVMLVGRPSLATAVQEGGGLVLAGPDGERQTIPGVRVSTNVNMGLEAAGGCDLVLLTVKAYDTEAAAAELFASGLQCPVLTLQNGVGNEETLAGVLGARSVASGAIDTPVSVPSPGVVEVHRARYGVGLAPVGPNPALVTRAESVFSGAGFTVQTYPDYRGLKWSKLLMNILANAACAILDYTPAQVMHDRVSSGLEARAWQEALAVMAAQGIRPVALAGYPLHLFAPLARRLPPRVLGRVLAGFVSGGRGSKSPSLQQALRAGRHSEVEWLNGAVARCGRDAGIPTPVNFLYARLLLALSAGLARPDDYRGQPDRLAALAAQLR